MTKTAKRPAVTPVGQVKCVRKLVRRDDDEFRRHYDEWVMDPDRVRRRLEMAWRAVAGGTAPPSLQIAVMLVHVYVEDAWAHVDDVIAARGLDAVHRSLTRGHLHLLGFGRRDG